MSRHIRAAALLAGALLSATASAGAAQGSSDWRIFRGDPQLTGRAQGELPRKLEPIWTFQAGDGIESTTAIHSGVVYVASMDGVVKALHKGPHHVTPVQVQCICSFYDPPFLGFLHHVEIETGKAVDMLFVAYASG